MGPLHLCLNFALLEHYWEQRRLTLVSAYYVPDAISLPGEAGSPGGSYSGR